MNKIVSMNWVYCVVYFKHWVKLLPLLYPYPYSYWSTYHNWVVSWLIFVFWACYNSNVIISVLIMVSISQYHTDDMICLSSILTRQYVLIHNHPQMISNKTINNDQFCTLSTVISLSLSLSRNLYLSRLSRKAPCSSTMKNPISVGRIYSNSSNIFESVYLSLIIALFKSYH